MRIPQRLFLIPLSLLGVALLSACLPTTQKPSESLTLRLGVSLTPQELETFQEAVHTLDDAHPEWTIILENTPQSGVIEKINTQLASQTLPDVIRVQGLQVQQWIQQNAFQNLDAQILDSHLDMTDFFPGPLDQFRWQGMLWGLPDTAAPEVVFYNKKMFDEAGLAYPSDDLTYDQMRELAVLLTLDSSGRNASEPDFDPTAIVQWGWNGGLTYFWQRSLVRGFGGDFCANQDCTLMNLTSPETVDAVEWWVELVLADHAALYDPYGGSQTGVPGDPFLSGKAAMGSNGFFAIGQLNTSGNINYDVIQPLIGRNGARYTPLSTTGYVINRSTKEPAAVWQLVLALLEPKFLEQAWGKPGHAIPARRSAANSAINLSRPPANQAALVAAMEYGEVFKPYTNGAFEVYAKTIDVFTKMNRGELSVDEALRQIEFTANSILARDRQP
jgi:multiple sugar transport system substrate-binding protein